MRYGVRLIFAALAIAFAGNTQGSQIFWTQGIGSSQTPGVFRSRFDRPETHDLIIGSPNPSGIAVDVTTRTIYWTDYAEGKLYSADFNGEHRRVLVSGLTGASSLEFDPQHRTLYWSEYSPGRIVAVDIDGSNRRTVYETDSSIGVPELCFDQERNRLLFVDARAHSDAIGSLDLDSLQTIYLLEGRQFVMGIAVDPDADTLFWSESLGAIYQADTAATTQREFQLAGRDFPLKTVSGRMVFDAQADQLLWQDENFISRDLWSSSPVTHIASLLVPQVVSADFTITVPEPSLVLHATTWAVIGLLFKRRVYL